MGQQVPLPPKDAKVFTTACDYCIVGCGYKAFVWPVGKEGEPDANENATGKQFPRVHEQGGWISQNQHVVTKIDGQQCHVVIIPDPDADVVNRGGNHSIRGGCLAQKVYREDGPTNDRLKRPMIRVNGNLLPVSWETALTLMAELSKHVISRHGVSAWGMKTYSYQYFENTYAISRMAFESIQTPAYSPHDKPGPGEDTAGLDWSGIDAFSASYEDWSLADVIFISGTDPYETKTVLFTEWIMKGGAKLIYALPRKTMGVAWAEANGGLFLQVIPGTDTILQLAIARVILENNWQDQEFIDKWVSNNWEISSGFGRGPRNTPVEWMTTWGKFGTDFAGFKKWLLEYKLATLEEASKTTGVPKEKIVMAAEMLSRSGSKGRPKASFGLEKGNYWSNNFLNTASFASLALICGAGNRPGRVVSRFGGHQRGWYGGASYPRILSPEKLPGRRKKEIDLDLWVEKGRLRFAWVIGTTWNQAMAGSYELMDSFRRMTRGNPHQIASVETALETLKKRVDSGGMVVVDQDIYPTNPIGTEFADIVLPAATWGECDFTRCNGERRLRLYSKFMDPPGEAQPDWWIIAEFAKRMGFKDYNWKDSNDVFEQAARSGRGSTLNYHPLVVYAKRNGLRAHEVLRKMGTTGIQCPIRMYKGELVGTKRLHDPELQLPTPDGPTVHPKWLTTFNTHTGKAILFKTPWEIFSDFYERIKPREGEFWVSNGRINEIWQSAFDDVRRAYIKKRFPDNFVEIHPDDAKRYGIESGDEVIIESDDVLIQTGMFVGVDDEELQFSQLEKGGHIRKGKGSCKGVAVVTSDVLPGVLFTNFLWLGSPANSLVHRVVDMITNRYRFKLARGRLRKLGESPYKKSFERMTFKPRTAI